MCVCRSPGVWDDLWIWAHWPCPQWCRLQVVMVAHHLWVTVVAVICVHAQLLHNLFTSLYTLFDSTTINWYGYRSAIYVGSKLSIFWKKWVFFPNQACFRCYLWLSITCVCCERSISKLMSCILYMYSWILSYHLAWLRVGVLVLVLWRKCSSLSLRVVSHTTSTPSWSTISFRRWTCNNLLTMRTL